MTNEENDRMEYINSFVYCDKITNEFNPTNGAMNRNIASPLNDLRPVSIPGNFTFSIACSISHIDVEKNNHVAFHFIDPDGNEIMPRIEAYIPQGTLIAPNGEKGNLNMDLEYRNLVFKSEGLYKTQVEFNKTILGEYPIEVKKAVINNDNLN